jgi:hypothetical protein
MGTLEMAVIRIPYVKEYVDQTGTVRRYFVSGVFSPSCGGSAESADVRGHLGIGSHIWLTI